MNPNINIPQDVFESVERYLNGSMPLDELQKFEEKLKNDSKFRSQFEDTKTLLFGVESQSLKEQLDGFHEGLTKPSIKENNTTVRFLNFKKMAFAAAVVIAAGSFWFMNQNSNASLYKDYFTPDPGLATTMSSSSNFEFYDAMVNYKKGDYTLAISKWEQLYTTKSQNDTLNYFLGMAYMASKNEYKAIPYLEKVTSKTNSTFKNDAYYYLGLSYLKNDNLELAKKNLTFSTIDNSKDLLSKLRD